MTKEEVTVFAETITHINNRTTITLNDATIHIGYFDNNMPENPLRKQNKWNFILSLGNKPIIVDGNQIQSIVINSI